MHNLFVGSHSPFCCFWQKRKSNYQQLADDHGKNLIADCADIWLRSCIKSETGKWRRSTGFKMRWVDRKQDSKSKWIILLTLSRTCKNISHSAIRLKNKTRANTRYVSLPEPPVLCRILLSHQDLFPPLDLPDPNGEKQNLTKHWLL